MDAPFEEVNLKEDEKRVSQVTVLEPKINTIETKEPNWVETSIPSRLDRLPFSGFHYFVVLALGITWMLDGLEVTLIGVVSGLLARSDTLHLSEFQIGVTASIYLAGCIIGSLIFGFMSDYFGRKKLYILVPWFFISLYKLTKSVYLLGTGLTAFSWNFATFSVLRFLTGVGLGGEYAAMNSAIDELIPCRVRGTVDLIVNGSYWLGTLLASTISLIVLNPNILKNADLSWRLMFGVGAFLGIIIIAFRTQLPESPRWLITHGRVQDADDIVYSIEERVCKWKKISRQELSIPERTIFIQIDKTVSLKEIAKIMLFVYPKRTFLALVLMLHSCINWCAYFCNTSKELEHYGVATEKVGIYLVPFAVGNFLGPLCLSRLFDILGRRIMICSTYALSGIILIVSGILFTFNILNAITQTIMWSIIAFFASAAASSAYLTVSEIFPLEIRAIAISIFYSAGIGLGGFAAPSLFGALLQTHKTVNIMYGYLFGALCMIFAALVEAIFGLSAERKSLEDLTPPVSAIKIDSRDEIQLVPISPQIDK